MDFGRCALANDIDLFDRIYGAWLGRAAGCALGKPVEKWPKQVIEEYLRHYDALPLDNYIPAIKASPANHPEHFFVSGMDCTRGNITLMPRDDDMDFTILGLSVLEDYAADFTSVDVGNAWLDRLPYNLVYTAERVAYRNLINDLLPPYSALSDNPFREWIGVKSEPTYGAMSRRAGGESRRNGVSRRLNLAQQERCLRRHVCGRSACRELRHQQH